MVCVMNVVNFWKKLLCGFFVVMTLFNMFIFELKLVKRGEMMFGLFELKC